MRVRAGKIGVEHRGGDRRRIGRRQPAGAQRIGEERPQGGGGYAPGVFGLGQHAEETFCVLIRLSAIVAMSQSTNQRCVLDLEAGPRQQDEPAAAP